jgi:hypothetical protein
MIFDDHCVDFARDSQRVLSTVSVGLEILLIVIEMNRSEVRLFPQNLPVIFAFIGMGFNATLLIGPIMDKEHFGSEQSTRNGLCY